MAHTRGRKLGTLDLFLQTYDPETGTITEAHTYSPTYSKTQVPFSSSAFDRKLRSEAKLVHDRLSNYNPDVPPWQHPILLYASDSNVTDSYMREALFEWSNFLETQSLDRVWEILMYGWVYSEEGPPEDFKWPDNFKMAFIEAFAKAMVVDSAFLSKFEGEVNHEYRCFTRNNVRRIFGNRIRQPTEVYFDYGTDPDLLFAKDDNTYATYPGSTVGFLLQYSENKRQPRKNFGESRLVYSDDPEEFVYRNCLMITPNPHASSVYGHPMLQRQLHAALGKIYLPFYSMLVLHKGGSNRVAVYPDSTGKEYKEIVKTEARRGLLSRGMAIGYKGNRLTDEFLIQEFPIPSLNFEAANTFLSEQGKTSRQDIEGAAETGALGGSSPDVNKANDLRKQDELLNAMEKAIREANDVFFGYPAYELKNGFYQPSYEIIFNRPNPENPEEIHEENPGENGNTTPPEHPERGAETDRPEAEANTVIKGWELYAEAHTVATVGETKYVTYRGNLFAPGEYDYPEKGYKVTYTAEEIRELTQNPVNKKDLELQHAYDFVQTGLGLSDNLGFLEVKGFDPETEVDITDFNIEEHTNARLVREGIIETDPETGKPMIKVSPFFIRKKINGKKRLFLLNAAVTDARKLPPRGEKSGLKTSARLIEREQEWN